MNNKHIIRIQATIRGFLIRRQLVQQIREQFAGLSKQIEGIEPRYPTQNHLNRPYFSRVKLIQEEINFIQIRLKEISKLKQERLLML